MRRKGQGPTRLLPCFLLWLESVAVTMLKGSL